MDTQTHGVGGVKKETEKSSSAVLLLEGDLNSFSLVFFSVQVPVWGVAVVVVVRCCVRYARR